MKRIISVLLTIFMVAGMMSFNAYAEDAPVTVNFKTSEGEFDVNKGSGEYFYAPGVCNWNISIPENGYYQLSVNNNFVSGSATFKFTCGEESISQEFTFETGNKTTVMQDYIYLEKGTRAVKFSTTAGGTIKDFTLTLKEKTTLVKFKATDGTIKNGSENGYFYDGGVGTYNVNIPVSGYYNFTVDHSLTAGATITVACENETISEKFEAFSDKPTTLANSIYLEKGTRTITFNTTKGGMVKSFVLALQKEEIHIDFNADTFTEDHNDSSYGFSVQTAGGWWYLDGKGLSYKMDNLPVNGVYRLSVWHSINSSNTFTASSGVESTVQSAAAASSKTETAFDDNIYLEKGEVLRFTPATGGVIYKFRLTLVSEETRISKSVSDCIEHNALSENSETSWYFYNTSYAVYDFALPANGKYDVLITYSGTPANDNTAVTYLDTVYSIEKKAHSSTAQETIVSGLEMYKKNGKVKISGLGDCNVKGVSLILRETIENISLTKLGYATVSTGLYPGNAENVIDGSTDTAWFFNVAGTGDTDISNKWVQINLDAPHKISQIRYLSGKNAAWDMFGKEISFRVSNDPEFRSYKEVASTTKNGAIPTDGATYYNVDINDQEEYRYIRAAKCVAGSSNLAMSCAEFEIIGSEEAAGNAAITFSKDAAAITQITDGICTAGTVVVNNKETDAEYSIIVGIYNQNGIMTQCFKKTAAIAQGQTEPLSIDFETDAETKKVQCAVFDGYDTALMTCDSNTLTAE